MTEHIQARLQRIEERVANLDDTVAILARVDDAQAKQRVEGTFGNDPSLIIIYRGIGKKLSQKKIAAELRLRGLPRADQADVSRACAVLEDKGFLKRGRKGYEIRSGWEAFGIDRALKSILKRHEVDPLE